MTCVCGHAEEKHGNNPLFPGSTECDDLECDCLVYEEDSSEAEDTEAEA